MAESTTPCSNTPIEKTVLDMVSIRSSRAMSKAYANEQKIKSDESAIQNQSKQINQVYDELPKSQNKKAYIYDTECVFDKYYDGTVLANVTTESGKSIPCVANIEGSYIRVTFMALEEVATVTITVI